MIQKSMVEACDSDKNLSIPSFETKMVHTMVKKTIIKLWKPHHRSSSCPASGSCSNGQGNSGPNPMVSDNELIETVLETGLLLFLAQGARETESFSSILNCKCN